MMTPLLSRHARTQDSIKCTARLTRLICDGEQHLPPSAIPGSTEKAEIRKRHQEQAFPAAEAILERLPQPQRRAMEVARLKGASSILTTLPIAEHGFYFECKSDLFDMVHLRYCWPITNLPSTCPCGAQYSLSHSQICKLAGFVKMRHDDATDFLAKCMKEVRNDEEVEPQLLSLTGETFRHRSTNRQPDAHADLRVQGFWSDSQNAFFDTRVFYPHANSYQTKSLASLFKSFENAKKWEYVERVTEVEHGSFTPLVFSSCGRCWSRSHHRHQAHRFTSCCQAERIIQQDYLLDAVQPCVLARALSNTLFTWIKIHSSPCQRICSGRPCVH